MNLFYETELQTTVFLRMVVYGMLSCVIFDLVGCRKKITVIIDILLFLSLGLIINMSMIAAHEETLRAYHLLGCMVGGIVYLFAERCLKWLFQTFTKGKSGEKKEKQM